MPPNYRYVYLGFSMLGVGLARISVFDDVFND